jgi:hypothetical protein
VTQDEGGLLRQSPSTPWRRVGDSVILAPPGRNDFDLLTGVGALVWEILEVPATMDELTVTLADVCDAGDADIGAEVGPLVEGLLRTGAIERIEDADVARR